MVGQLNFKRKHEIFGCLFESMFTHNLQWFHSPIHPIPASRASENHLPSRPLLQIDLINWFCWNQKARKFYELQFVTWKKGLFINYGSDPEKNWIFKVLFFGLFFNFGLT
jgi:hypothetical protein